MATLLKRMYPDSEIVQRASPDKQVEHLRFPLGEPAGCGEGDAAGAVGVSFGLLLLGKPERFLEQ